MVDATSLLNKLCYGPCAPVYFGNVYACEHEFEGVLVEDLRAAVLGALEALPNYTIKPNPFTGGGAAGNASDGGAGGGEGEGEGGRKARNKNAVIAGAGEGAGEVHDADAVVVSRQPGSVNAGGSMGGLAPGADAPFKRIRTATQLAPAEAFVGMVIAAPELGVFARYRTPRRQFTDDLSFTFKVSDGGSESGAGRVTMRAVSASRVGISDFGQNYRR